LYNSTIDQLFSDYENTLQNYTANIDSLEKIQGALSNQVSEYSYTIARDETILANIYVNHFTSVSDLYVKVFANISYYKSILQNDVVHDRILSVSVDIKSSSSGSFYFTFDISIDFTNLTDVEVLQLLEDIQALVCGSTVAELQTQAENIFCSQPPQSGKRSLNQLFTANVTQALTTQNINQVFGNTVLPFNVPSVSQDDINTIGTIVTQLYDSYKTELESESIDQLIARVAVLTSQLQDIVQQTNLTTKQLEQLARSYYNYIISTYQNDLKETTITATSDNATEIDIVRAFASHKIAFYNNTCYAINIVENQYQIQYNAALSSKISAEIDVVNVLISLQNASITEKVVISIQKDTLELYFFQAWQRLVISNYTIEYIENQEAQCQTTLATVTQQANDVIQSISSQSYKTIQQIKSDWKGSLDIVRQDIERFIEDYIANVSVLSDDFDDVVNGTDPDTFNVGWTLNVTFTDGEDPQNKLDLIKTVITHIIIAESGCSSSIVNVDIKISSKRASNVVSASASVGSSNSSSGVSTGTSTGASTGASTGVSTGTSTGTNSSSGTTSSNTESTDDTYYIIGGVVAGVVLLAIIVVVVLVVVKKRHDERV